MIKFFGLDRQYQCLKEEILHTTNEVLRSGQVLDGPYVKKFESAVAERCNRTYAIAVNSCTQALEFVQHCHQYKSKKIGVISKKLLHHIACMILIKYPFSWTGIGTLK